jgi:hypoxanthine phosphoribosyltransferase
MKKTIQETNLGWEHVEVLINRLVSQIRGSEVKFDLILSLNRGGLIPGTILSHRLGIRHAVMSIESYSDKRRGSLRGGTCISSSVYPKKKHLNVLIVDDIADSGKSFLFAAKKLAKNRWSAIYYETAALHWKPKSTVRPIYVGEAIHNEVWVNYPWEKK